MNNERRKYALQCWLLDHNLSQDTIAQSLGISRQRVSGYLSQDEITKTVWDRFVAAGVPEEFLPEPRELGKRGRPRRTGKLIRKA